MKNKFTFEKSLEKFILFFAISTVSISIFLLCFLLPLKYDDFISLISKLLNKPEWNNIIVEQFSKAQFLLTKKTVLFSTLCYILILIPFLIIKKKPLTFYLKNIMADFNKTVLKINVSIRSLEKTTKIALATICFLFFAKSFYYIFTYHISYDEAWTYNHFISKSFIIPFIAPSNNHVLYTIIANFFSLLPIEPIRSIRLPLPLVGLASGLLLFLFLRMYIHEKYALLIFAFYLSSGWVTKYALYGRGYIFTFLFVLLLIWSVIKIATLKYPNSKQIYYLVYVLSFTLGVYAVPSFSFAIVGVFIPAMIILLYKKRLKRTSHLVAVTIISILLSLILYSPMILSVGFNWLFEGLALEKSSISLTQIKRWILVMGSQTLSTHLFYAPYLFLILISIGLPFFIEKKKRTLAVIISFSIIFPLLLVYIFQASFETRIFSYSIVLVSILFGLLAQYLSQYFPTVNKPIFLFLTITLFTVNSYLSHNNPMMQWNKEVDHTSHIISKRIKENRIKEVYNFFPYLKPIIEYQYLKSNSNIKILMSEEASLDYQIFDSEKKYESIIWKKGEKREKPNFSNYNLVYEDNLAALYLVRH